MFFNRSKKKSLVAITLFGLAGHSVNADHPLEEVIVERDRDTRLFNLADTVDVSSDPSALLKKAVGANVISNGPLTGIAQYRGMSRFRVNTQINGTTISAGGPNWMDPPLSYAPAALLESLEVHRGIAPVSAGTETIGGAINAKTWRADFSETGTAIQGRVRSSLQSVNDGYQIGAGISVANSEYVFQISGLHEEADDAEFSDGKILPTEYERNRFDLGFGLRSGHHTFRLDIARNETGDSGTPALPMDIVYIDTDIANFLWEYRGEDYSVDTKVFYSDIEHGMTNYALRQPPGMAGMYRRNVATGDNLGMSVAVQLDNWKFGIDAHQESHDSDIDNPNNAAFFVVNFNDAERRLLGLFAEKKVNLDNDMSLELGARLNRIDMEADSVAGTPGAALQNAFNNADRSSTDNNVDWVVRLNQQTSRELNLYAGLARKTRSPAYQEKFLWLPLQATAGLADGRTYTGNLDLDPEVAHELELGLDWESSKTIISPRLFYRDVKDYIQGTEPGAPAAVMFVNMMNVMNGTNNAPPLEFNNVDAVFYGFDIDWSHQINHHWSLNGVLNYVRGKRDDIKDDLYRVAPLNGLVAINYAHSDWKVSLENFIYRKQDKVSATNRELPSSGYGVINLKGSWQSTEQLKIGFGIDNVADRRYSDHLAGVNRVNGNADLAVGERLPATGRNIFARVDYSW